MKKSGDAHLRTHAQDRELHSQRRIFVVLDGRLELAPAGTTCSHLEWCEAMGWCGEENRVQFMEQTVRGMYLPQSNQLYAYQGNGFFFSETTRLVLLQVLRQLRMELGLTDETEVFLGPRDAVVHGVEYEQAALGSLHSLLGCCTPAAAPPTGRCTAEED